MQKSKIIFLFLIAVLLITSGAKCGSSGETDTLKLGKPTPITLEYWRSWDESSSFSDIIKDYQNLHPYVKINYRLIRNDEYENELLNAMAEDRGPDIFSVPNTSIRKYLTKIEPLPAKITMQYDVVKGTVKKVAYREYRTTNSLSIRSLKDNFLDVVTSDVLINDKIYSLPLSVDTMALFYNKDLLNNANIVNPPKTWDEFQQNVIKLTAQDRKGNILQAGAAIGTTENVSRSSDILSLLMMQNGAIMSDENNYAFFAQMPPALKGRTTLPSEEALTFYTDFASPTKQVYTWNEQMPNSLDAFIAGKTAFFFGYSYQITTIKAQAPKLNFSVATMPQIIGNTPINFANYWTEVVSKKTKNLNEAWDFIQYMAKGEKTGNAEDPQAKTYNVKSYLDKTKKPTALRTLIDRQAEDLDIAPFVSQLLSAKSWYRGIDPVAAESAMQDMITLNLSGAMEIRKIIQLGATKVNQTIK